MMVMAKTDRLGTLAAAAGATLVAVGLLMLMLVVVEAGPAGATFPGKNGKIAYSGQVGATGDFEIYTINPDGGGKFHVTDNATIDSEPAYSPSGQKIAYEGREGGPNGDYEIYTINSGGGRFNVTDNAQDDYEPSWGAIRRREGEPPSLLADPEEVPGY